MATRPTSHNKNSKNNNGLHITESWPFPGKITEVIFRRFLNGNQETCELRNCMQTV